METIGSKRSYALTWCMPNNDDDDDGDDLKNRSRLWVGVNGTRIESRIVQDECSCDLRHHVTLKGQSRDPKQLRLNTSTTVQTAAMG